MLKPHVYTFTEAILLCDYKYIYIYIAMYIFFTKEEAIDKAQFKTETSVCKTGM